TRWLENQRLNVGSALLQHLAMRFPPEQSTPPIGDVPDEDGTAPAEMSSSGAPSSSNPDEVDLESGADAGTFVTNHQQEVISCPIQPCDPCSDHSFIPDIVGHQDASAGSGSANCEDIQGSSTSV
ncbi:unnamed protein product, partial [Allacma fusca]